MKCLKCGFEVSEGQTVCPNCGEAIKNEASNDDVNKEVVESTPETVDNSQSKDGMDNFFEFNDMPTTEGGNDSKQEPIENQDNQSLEQSDSISESGNKKEEENRQLPKKNVQSYKTKNIIPLIIAGTIVSVLVVALVGVIIYFKIMNTPKYLFKKGINRVSNSIFSIIDTNPSKISNTINYSVEKTGDSDNELLNAFANLNFDLDVSRDYNEHSMLANIKFNYKDNSVFNGTLYAEGKDLYVYSSNLNDKWIKIESGNELIAKNNADVNELRNIVKELINAVSISLKDSYFNTYKDQLNINQTEIDVINNQLIIDDSNIKEIERNIYKYLSNSNKYINAQSYYTGREKADIKEALKKKVDDLSKDETIVSFDKKVFSIYTTGFRNEFVKFSVQDEINGEEKFSIVKVSDQVYEISMGSAKYILNVLKNKNEKTYTLEYGNIKIKIQSNKDTSKNVTKPSISSVVDYNQLSAEEQFNMLNKITSGIMNDLSGYLNLINSYKDSLGSYEYQENTDNSYNNQYNEQPNDSQNQQSTSNNSYSLDPESY